MGADERPVLGVGLLSGVVIVLIATVFVISVTMIIGSSQVGNAAGCQGSADESGGSPRFQSGRGGDWLATAYGPPWNSMEGWGVTATNIDLRPARPAYIIAVDPSVIPLGSYVRVSPNPFNNDQIVFKAADTGEAIVGQHIDIYDWRGRVYQNGWGERMVRVTPAPYPGAGNALGATAMENTPFGCTESEPGAVALTPGETAKLLPNGDAAAPTDLPEPANRIVRAIIAAGNEINSKPYPEPDVHYGPLNQMWPAYDCSGSVSYLLYRGGLHSVNAQNSGELESWGTQGAGRYLTIYTNAGHVFLDVAGVVFNTAHYWNTTPPGTGPRWQPGSTVALQTAGDVYGGFVERHWPGL